MTRTGRVLRVEHGTDSLYPSKSCSARVLYANLRWHTGGHREIQRGDPAHASSARHSDERGSQCNNWMTNLPKVQLFTGSSLQSFILRWVVAEAKTRLRKEYSICKRILVARPCCFCICVPDMCVCPTRSQNSCAREVPQAKHEV